MVAKGAYSNYLTYFATPANPWDISSAALIIRQSGGVLSDLAGNPIDPLSAKGYILASSCEQTRDEFCGLFEAFLQA
jgi:fructose-1,6-bisphosphatase/inositol monophosphatase family enzyme